LDFRTIKRTAKVWDVETAKCKYTLEEHEHAVAVLAMEGGLILTGSKNGKINYWQDGKKVMSYLAHDGIFFCKLLYKI